MKKFLYVLLAIIAEIGLFYFSFWVLFGLLGWIVHRYGLGTPWWTFPTLILLVAGLIFLVLFGAVIIKFLSDEDFN